MEGVEEFHRRLRNSTSFQALKMSFASPDFVNGMRQALESDNAVIDENDARVENELVEDALAIDAVGPVVHPESLSAPPVMSQQSSAGDNRMDDREVEMLDNDNSTLTMKTQKIHTLMERDEEHRQLLVQESPVEMMERKHAQVNAMPVTDIDARQSSVKLYNTINALLAERRQNEDVRDFVGTLFHRTQQYYDMKDERKTIRRHLKILIQLRDQQELANHVEKQQKRTRQEFEEKKAKAARTFTYGNAK